MQNLWKSPGSMKKNVKGSSKKKGKSSDPFSNSTSLQDMKTNTLSDENGGWGKKGVKASKGFKVGRGKKGDKIFKSMGF